MKATANSQTIEQLFKTIFTVVLVEFIAMISKTDTKLMAAGANFATTLATIGSFIYLYRYYKVRRGEIAHEIKNSVNYKRNYITAVFEEELIEKLNIETLRKLLGSYMELPYKEETYTMDKEETPLLYAAKMNPISSFKTLEIISNTTVIE